MCGTRGATNGRGSACGNSAYTDHLRTSVTVAAVLLALLAPWSAADARPIVRTGLLCGDDPIAGTWQGRADNPSAGYGELITVTIRRAGADLSGMARTDYWTGAPGSPVPTTCSPGMVHRLLDARIVGRLTGSHLEWWLADGDVTERVLCGGPSGRQGGRGRSIGTVDPRNGTFFARFVVDSPRVPGQVVRDVPVYYRRIACAPGVSRR